MMQTSIKFVFLTLVFIFSASLAQAQSEIKQNTAESALPTKNKPETSPNPAPTPAATEPTAPVAEATPVPAATAAPVAAPVTADDEQCNCWHKGQRSWSIVISPRYMHFDQGNTDTALKTNGFSAVSRDSVGAEIKGLWEWNSGWQFGIAVGNYNNEQDLGNYEANFTNNYFGGYFGYDFGGFGDTTFYAGTGLGYSGTQLEIFSAVQNGRVNGTAAYVNPTVGVDHLMSHWLKLGISASYFYSFLQGASFVGQNLSAVDISPSGFSAQVNISLGHF